MKRYPRAVFKGNLQSPVDGVPTQMVGELTLRGVTRPLTQKVHSLKCIQHPMLKRDYCGADAIGSFNRDDFGLGTGKGRSPRAALKPGPATRPRTCDGTGSAR